MGSLFIVFSYPSISNISDFGKVLRNIHVQHFFPISPVKSFDKSILYWLTRLNEFNLPIYLSL